MPDTLSHIPVSASVAADSLAVPTVDSLAISAADSLAMRAVDSLAQIAAVRADDVPYQTFCTAETLQELLAAEGQVPVRTVAPEQLYGVGSLRAEVPAEFVPRRQTLTDNFVYQGVVLALAVTYAMLIYRNLGDIRMLLDRISRDKATGERLSEDPGSSGFSRFLHLTTAIGLLFMSVIVIKYSDSLVATSFAEMLPHTAVMVMTLVGLVACLGVMLYQAMTIRIVAAVTLTQEFFEQLVLLKRTYFALLVIIASPALLLFALCPYGRGGVWFFVVVAELAVTLILYLKETLNLFLAKKISILHWFLYLCAVEIFPISFLCLLAVR